MSQRFVTMMASSCLASIALIPAAWAQDQSTEDLPGTRTAEEAAAEDAASEGKDASAIVVTGTLLRGVAPGGSQTIAIQDEEIAATGATSASQLLSKIPQAGTFNTEPAVRGVSGSSISINRPTLRNLGNAAASSSSTLLLLDGHRLPGMGITQTGPDVDSIPTGAIERVEIVPDGGSSIYGSDAIGGVINFITRKTFDGVSARARYGVADDYNVFDSNLTVGKAWDWGSAYVSYDYVHNDKIYGFDRDYFTGTDYVNSQVLGQPVGSDTNCAPGNIRATVGTTPTFFALPALTTDARNLGNRCDSAKFTTVFPSQERHSLFGRVTVDDGGPVSFSLTGFYMNRDYESDAGPLRNSAGFTVQRRIGNQTTGPLNPFYVVLPGVTGTPSETFFFNFSPVFGDSSLQKNTLETYGITPAVRFDLGSRWQLNAFANFGDGVATFKGQTINPAPITAAINAGTFDPVNLGASGNAAALAAARDAFTYARGHNRLFNARTVVDGPLFALPGGDVKIAAGAEYSREEFDLRSNALVTAAAIPNIAVSRADRRVQSLFGEINVPIVGADNRGFIHSLSFSASGRYDKYSDFGNTFNPKFGITLEPIEWIRLRGNYGKSFQAPSLNDIAGAAVSSVNSPIVGNANALAFFGDPDVPATATANTLIFFGGTNLPLQPQKAKTYSLGFDVRPPIIEGLSFGGTYFNVKFRNLVDSPPVGQGNVFYDNFPDQYVIYTQGIAAVQVYLDTVRGLVNNPAVIAGVNASQVYAIIDQRRQNLSGVFTDGLDFYVRYRRPTDFGAVFFDINGNYILNFERQLSQSAPFVEIATGTSTADVARLRMSSTLGAEIGSLRAQGTWNYVEGYPVLPNAANLMQTRVKSYSLFNLFFEYKVPGESMLLKDLAFTLNVDNVFDKDPPLFRGNQGFGNGQTLGRLVKVGVSKKF